MGQTYSPLSSVKKNLKYMENVSSVDDITFLFNIKKSDDIKTKNAESYKSNYIKEGSIK